MKLKPSLTIIIPAYNEAKNIRAAYENTIRSLKTAEVSDYEIIIITNNRRDGSNDGTPAIADAIAQENSRVRRIHNPYVDLGFKYHQGVQVAKKDCVMMIPGDNETDENAVTEILAHLGEADLIITYTSNKEVRVWKRRFVSWGFTTLCNILFGLNLKYFNGVCVHPRRYLQATPMECNNFAYMAEILIYLVKSGVTYKEVPIKIKPITNVSSAFKLKSVFEVLGTLSSLFWKIHFQRKRVIMPAT